MGGGGVVEMVEMVEMYLQNKYTKTPPSTVLKINIMVMLG
jgi:hypothetical protein